MRVAIGFVGDYAPGGLSPQMYNMPVIPQQAAQLNIVVRLVIYCERMLLDNLVGAVTIDDDVHTWEGTIAYLPHWIDVAQPVHTIGLDISDSITIPFRPTQ